MCGCIKNMINKIKKRFTDWIDGIKIMFAAMLKGKTKDYTKRIYWKDLDNDGKDLVFDLQSNQNDFIFSWLLLLSSFVFFPNLTSWITWPIRSFFGLTFVVRLRALFLAASRFKQCYL